jgi:hypothetical protein
MQPSRRCKRQQAVARENELNSSSCAGYYNIIQLCTYVRVCAVDNKSLVSRSRVHIYRVKRATTTNTRSSVIIIFFFFFIIPRPRFYQIESQLSKRPLQRPGLPSEEYNKAHDFAFWLERSVASKKRNPPT